MDRLNHVEHDVMLLQKQVAQSGTPVDAANVPPGNVAASLDVRLSAIEDQLRQLRGQIEETQFQVKKLSEDVAKSQRDTDFRFNELAGKSPDASASPAPPASDETPAAPEEKTTLKKKTAPSGLTTAGSGILTPPGAEAKNGTPETPREQYNYAFRLLNQTQYPEAAAAFAAFTKRYPNDPLIGNAYYWEGETYYIRRDYVKAADHFRQGFEALPDGPKAADNLLKLAISLDALDRDKDACVVLQQIVTKYRKNSTSITGKAEQEQKRIGCK
ncbi:MAG: tol-pal system protein YbgF [Pseudomonadota bacterium]|nr:tol-pal system protein YbgF [Pseudomonadota bacterium]MDE3037499.1 tol-pal system protein YbgF [Pseudomonadota bacterium]